MRSIVRTLVFALLALSAAATFAQDLHPSRRASPMGMARTLLSDGSYVSVVYSRPYKRGRDNVFGGEGALVPNGELWRTGANEATQLTTTGDVMIGDQKLPAGTYSIFTTPGETTWKVHFNSRLMLWGPMGNDPETGERGNLYDAANDVVTYTADVGTTEEEVDQLTLAFEDQEDGSSHLVLTWIDKEVRIPFAPAG